jgi:tetratricopeptide (TPR) repeat protein
MEMLNRSESCMSSSPDSALAILETLDTVHFESKRQNARYALLKSIALDKNFIDRTDDSLINIAVNYYCRHYNTLYKFKSYYYQARVYQNAGLMDKAMESLVRAEQNLSNKISSEDRARLHIVKSQILSSRYDYSDNLISELELVEFYSLEAGKMDNYVLSLLDQAKVYIIRREFNDANRCLVKIKGQDSLSHRSKVGYNKLNLCLAVNSRQPLDTIASTLNEYLTMANDSSEVNWEFVAQAYMQLGKDSAAIYSLNKYLEYNDPSADEAYYFLKSKAYYSLGNYQEAYDNLNLYSDISDSLDMIRMSQEVNSIKERFENRQLIRRQHLILCIIALIGVVSISILALYIFRKRTESKRLKQKYNDLKEEYQYLSKAMENCKSKIISNADEETLKILDRRIKALGTFLSQDMPDSLSKVADRLEDLTANKNIVTDSIGMLYAIYHPTFVLELENYGLTASEVGFCCLLILGLRTSELSPVVNKSNTYNISSQIRAKLKLDHNSGKLANWLAQLFESSEKAK